MPDDAKTLREYAERARRLSKSIADPATCQTLIDYGQECEAKADEIDARNHPLEEQRRS